MAMMKLLPQQLKSLRQVSKGLLRRYEGPFQILAKVGKVAYNLALPDSLKVHPVVHVSMLKPYHFDLDEPSRGESSRAPTLMFQSNERDIKEILANKVIRRKGVSRTTEYLVHWEGLPREESSWEKEKDLWQFKKEIAKYLAKKATEHEA
ncbi:hypothetical protein V2J09_023180 [Rumex salicifolius]